MKSPSLDAWLKLKAVSDDISAKTVPIWLHHTVPGGKGVDFDALFDMKTKCGEGQLGSCAHLSGQTVNL